MRPNWYLLGTSRPETVTTISNRRLVGQPRIGIRTPLFPGRPDFLEDVTVLEPR